MFTVPIVCAMAKEQRKLIAAVNTLAKKVDLVFWLIKTSARSAMECPIGLLAINWLCGSTSLSMLVSIS